MATRVWIGVTGDWDTVTNWSGGAKPATGDVVVFDSSSVVSPTSNLDQNTVALNALKVYSGYTGSIGSSGNPLKIDVSNGTNPFLQFEGGSGSQLWITGDITEAVLNTDTTPSTAQLYIGSTAKTVTKFELSRGHAQLHTGITVTTLNVKYASSASSDVQLTINSGAVVTTANVKGGSVTSAVCPTTLNLDGGIWTSNATSGTITTLNANGNGRFVYGAAGTTITTANIDGTSTLDASSLRSGTATTTISNLRLRSNQANLYIDNALALTLTNGIIVEQGGTQLIRFDPGTTLTVA